MALPDLGQQLQAGAATAVSAGQATNQAAATAAQMGMSAQQASAQVTSTRMNVDAQKEIAQKRFVSDMIGTIGDLTFGGLDTYADFVGAAEWSDTFDAMSAEAKSFEDKMKVVDAFK